MAAKAATTTIPIVFANGSDPVKHGVVARLSRPGGNVTGVTFVINELGPKRFELLKELLPSATALAWSSIRRTRPAFDAEELQAAGRLVGVRIVILRIATEAELEKGFAAAVEQRAHALLITNDAISRAGQSRSPHWRRNIELPAITHTG